MRVLSIQSRFYNYQQRPNFKKAPKISSSGNIMEEIRKTEDQFRFLAQNIVRRNNPNANIKELGEAGTKALAELREKMTKDISGVQSVEEFEFLSGRACSNQEKQDLSELYQYMHRLTRDLSIEQKRSQSNNSARHEVLAARANGTPFNYNEVNQKFSNADKKSDREIIKILLESNPETSSWI